MPKITVHGGPSSKHDPLPPPPAGPAPVPEVVDDPGPVVVVEQSAVAVEMAPVPEGEVVAVFSPVPRARRAIKPTGNA